MNKRSLRLKQRKGTSNMEPGNIQLETSEMKVSLAEPTLLSQDCIEQIASRTCFGRGADVLKLALFGRERITLKILPNI